MPIIPDHKVPPQTPPAAAIVHVPNKVAPHPSSNGFTNLQSLDSEDDSVINEMVDNDKMNHIKYTSSYTTVLHDNFPGFACQGGFILRKFKNQFCACSSQLGKKCESGSLLNTNIHIELWVLD